MSTTTTARPTSFAIGDKVTPDPLAGWPDSALGIVYQITKVPTGARGVNYTAAPVDAPGRRGIKGPASILLPAGDDAEATPTATPVPAYVPCPPVGTIVTVEGIPKLDPRALFVVLGEARRPNAAKLARVGGDGGRYWTAIPLAACTVVDPSRVVLTP